MIDEKREYIERIQNIRQELIEAYGMPISRDPLPPVDELVSTILSQNTNDDNRDAAFQNLKSSFKDWEDVMNADTDAIIEAIRTAGLANQKGPRIQQALKDIADHNDGDINLAFLRDLPKEQARHWLMERKGVGPKTVAIVLLFALGIPAFPVDTHIYRVTGRLGIRPKDLSVQKTHTYLEERIPQDAFYDLHLNLIRLGRQVCGARKWQCYRCPVENLCEFKDKNLTPPE
ncbi:MAG: endonuclease III domain-containing protein [Anaerolineales bacterium]